jgi:hypothetical protein
MAINWSAFTPNGRGLLNGRHLNDIFTGARNILALAIQTTLSVTGASTFTGATTFTGAATFNGGTVMSGAQTAAPQILTAAGATQGNATAITGGNALITVALTASTKGVRLPTAVTGMLVRIGNLATFGVKVYPATNGKIGAASTNSADSTVLAINKGNVYWAQNTTKWVVFRGA